MDHCTVKVIYPWDYPSSAVDCGHVLQTFEELTFRTEQWMNEQYTIDYRVEDVEGKHWIEELLHKENPGANYNFRIRQYIDAKVFPDISTDRIIEEHPGGSPRPAGDILQQTAASPQSAGKDIAASRIALGLGWVIVFIAGIVLVAMKHKSMLKAQVKEGNRVMCEYQEQPGSEVLVIRQPATKNSGYFTDDNVCMEILTAAMIAARAVEGEHAPAE
jgi:hypothetical protein